VLDKYKVSHKVAGRIRILCGCQRHSLPRFPSRFRLVQNENENFIDPNFFTILVKVKGAYENSLKNDLDLLNS
jgi:hypothetical protein